MLRSSKYLISMVALGTLWGETAQADPAPPAQAAAAAPSLSSGQVGGPEPSGSLTDAQLLQLAEQGEQIEIFDERPDKPFDRDTEVRLTGEELAARGAVDLGTALALLPDVSVRDAGRGGFNVDIRGARKGAVSILVDGVLVTDPYYGTFDVSTIPITDIVQIRVATTPQSPIDGPGGPGGVIEVHTRDAIGEQLEIVRLTGDSLPSVGATATARFALARHLALRLSASGQEGARDFDVPGPVNVGEARHTGTGAGRLEYRDGDRRIAIDGFFDARHYIAPPSDEGRISILQVDRETTGRGSVKYDDKLGAVQVQAEAWGQYLYRRSRTFTDAMLDNESIQENLTAWRSGGMALVTQPFLRDFRWALSTTLDYEKAKVSDLSDKTVGRGDTTIIEPAADLQFEHGPVRVDVSGGVALPYGVGADPWPEGKGVVKVRPLASLELTATAAYKGRPPSLRERFDSVVGNPELGPERIAQGELRAVEHINDRVHLELAPFYKRSTGTIISSLAANGRLVNLGVVKFWGGDALARVTINRALEVGGGYEYIKARSDETGDDPLDRLPHNRWEAWGQIRPVPWITAIARAKYYGQAFSQGVKVDGYVTVEASAAAQITKAYLAVLRIDDLMDEAPETRPGVFMPGRTYSLVVQGQWQ
ncbi:MAG TPA: TonB-dependent receptor [Kofleriaceae bacterium]|nr:TonB-dependent receptor [Kofleriaceae bacterium]